MTEVLPSMGWRRNAAATFAIPALGFFRYAFPSAHRWAHAVGAAYSFMLRREERSLFGFIGDGGCGNGAFMGRSTWREYGMRPSFVVRSTIIAGPSRRRGSWGSASENPCAKGIAAGVEGRQCGPANDVHRRVCGGGKEAIEKAREGGRDRRCSKPSVYRLGDHTRLTTHGANRGPRKIVRSEWRRNP